MKKSSPFFIAVATAMLMFTSCEENKIENTIYTVAVTSAGNGAASTDATEAVPGQTVTLTATPDEGYLFSGWTIDGLEEYDPAENPLSFSMPENNVTAEAAFVAEQKFTVTVETAENGKVEADAAEAPAGATVTLTATADDGYEFGGWEIEGLAQEYDPDTNPLAFTMPANGVTVSARFFEAGVDILTDVVKDDAFRQFLKEQMFGGMATDPRTGEEIVVESWDADFDGKLTPREAAAVKMIVLEGYYISNNKDDYGDPIYNEVSFSDIAGIEYFTGLEVLSLSTDCLENTYYNEHTLDLSKFTHLEYLRLYEVDSYGLPITFPEEFPALKYLNLSYCWLSEFNVSLPAVETLIINGNDFYNIDLSHSTKLKELTVGDLDALDLSSCPDLETLIMDGDIPSVDLSKTPAITTLYAYGNGALESIDISGLAATENYDVRINRLLVQYNSLTGHKQIKMRKDQKDYWDANLADNQLDSPVYNGNPTYKFNVDVTVETVD